MGNKATGGATTLKPNVLKSLQDSTHFEQDEIIGLHEHFKSIAGVDAQHETIDRALYLHSLGMKRSRFLERMFELFDLDRDGRISFPEYAAGLSVLCARGTLDEKVKFAFQIYDVDGDGRISKHELLDMLKTTLEEASVTVTPNQLHNIVEFTFKQADLNGDGFIDEAEFRALTDERRSMLSNMTIDFKAMLGSAPAS